MKKTTNGFTIIELLIVIVVIAILALIAVVAYNGIQTRAVASAVRSDLNNFTKTIEILKATSVDGTYPSYPTPDMGIKPSKSMYATNRSNWYYCTSPDFTRYAIGVVDSSNRGYYMSSRYGLQADVSGVNALNTCALVEPPAAITYSLGYQWNGTTGVWNAWAN